MIRIRRLLALPLAALALASPIRASEVRDRAKMFSPEAIRQAQATLDRAESRTRVPTIIETVPSLGGESIEDASMAHARRSGIRGVYVLIARDEKELQARTTQDYLGHSGRRAIEGAFAAGFRRGDFDAGLLKGSEAIASAVTEAGPLPSGRAQAPDRRGAPVPGGRRPQGSSGLGVLLVIGAVILGVLFLTRMFGRANRGAYGGPPGPGGPMGGPGGYGAPGYGAPGFGGRGGFFSGLLGGLGGAMAGNWLYDQFSGRHHHHPDSTGGAGYAPGEAGPPADAGGDWGSPSEGGTSWGDGGGTSWGGGDVADAGGGWGGGGDWGGGGGDWGGGGGGGDWT